MNIGLYVSNENRRKLISEDLESLFSSNEIFGAHVTAINVDASQVANIKTPVKLEQLIMKQYEVKPGNLLIIEWKNLEDDILVSTDRTIFISDKVGEF
jgi:GPI-anchor transamidase subunit S